MEVVGAVASVAGIISLAGQSLKSITAVAKFVQDAKQSPAEISAVLRETQELRGILENIKLLGPALEEVYSSGLSMGGATPVAALSREVSACHRDMADWCQRLSKHAPGPKAGFSSIMKKMKFAVLGKDDLAKLRNDISSKKQTLTLVMALVTSFLGQHGAHSVNQIQHKVTDLTQSNLKMSNTLIEVSDRAAKNGRELWDLSAQGFAAIEASITISAEKQQRASSARHKETQSNMSSVGESLATLATSVSRMADKIARLESRCSSPGPRNGANKSRSKSSFASSFPDDAKSTRSHQLHPRSPRRAKPQSRSSSRAAQTKATGSIDAEPKPKEQTPMYCCDAVSGIDDAFRPLRGPGSGRTMQCIYCWDLFEEASSRTLGKHLVDAHAFGQCDLEHSYRGWTRFLRHLDKVHNTKFPPNEPQITRQLFVPPNSEKYKEVTNVKNGLTNTPCIENATEDVCIETRMRMLLENAGLYSTPGRHFRPRDRVDLADSLRSLEERAFSHEVSQNLIPLLCEAACLEEELIVQCDRPLPYNWSLFSLYKQFASGALDLGAERPRPRYAECPQKYWLCIEPHHSLFRSAALTRCTPCDTGKIYSSVESALHHLRFNHPNTADGEGGAMSWVASHPQPLDYRDAAPMVNRTGSISDWFDSWLVGVFFESDYLRTLLRSGVVFEKANEIRDTAAIQYLAPRFKIPTPLVSDPSWTLHVNQKIQSGARLSSYLDKPRDNHSEVAVGSLMETESVFDRPGSSRSNMATGSLADVETDVVQHIDGLVAAGWI